MDTTYTANRGRKNRYLPLFIALILILVVGTGIFIFSKRAGLVSPIPPEPAVEIIFYTPTPEPVTPTSTPSASPSIRPTAAATRAVPTMPPSEDENEDNTSQQATPTVNL